MPTPPSEQQRATPYADAVRDWLRREAESAAKAADARARQRLRELR